MYTTLLVSGISLGSFYTLIALGFALIYGVTRYFNLAHGDLLVLSGYVAYWFCKLWAWSFWVTFPLAVLAMLPVCYLLQRIFSRLEEPLELNSIVLSFGLSILIQNGMLLCFTGDYRFIRVPELNRGFSLGGAYISYGQLTLLVLSLLAITCTYLLMRHTYVGKTLRATIQDKEAAALAGINVAAMGTLAFCLGAVLIGLAGPLYGSIHYIFPVGGHEATLLAVTITIFAGVGRLRGIILAGWILGVGESLAVVFLGASWREMVTALMLLTMLAVKPHGLFGSDGR